MRLRAVVVAGLSLCLQTAMAVAYSAPSTDWKLSSATEVGYNDNVFEYSDQDIAVFRSGSDPQRFGFETIGDFYLTQEVSGRRLIAHHKRERTYLEPDVRVRLYRHDADANDLRLRVGVQHLWSQRRWVQARVTYLPSYFVRRLYDKETDSFRPAGFAYAAVEAKYWERLSDQWSGDVTLGWENRNYGSAFAERDANNLIGAVAVKYQPSDLWEFRVGVEAQRSTARATDGVPGLDVDNSYDEVAYGLAARYRLSESDSIEGRWAHERRRYTSDLTPAEDPWHAGRDDRLNGFAVRYRRSLDAQRALEVEWRREQSSSNLPGALAPSPRDESLSYEQNRVSVTYSQDF